MTLKNFGNTMLLNSTMKKNKYCSVIQQGNHQLNAHFPFLVNHTQVIPVASEKF